MSKVPPRPIRPTWSVPMIRYRLIVATGVVAAVGALPLPASAAGSRTLYFNNAGATGKGPCTPSYVLTLSQPAGSPCAAVRAGVDGNGLLGDDEYSNDSRAKGFVLDAKRKLTGVVYVATYSPVGLTLGPTSVSTTPGYVGATITIAINGVKVGQASSSGPVASPGGAYAIPVSLKLPGSLNRTKAKS